MANDTHPQEHQSNRTRSGSNRSKKKKGKNKGDNDLLERSLSTAVPDSPPTDLEGGSELSPTNIRQLPAEDVNKASSTNVSDLSVPATQPPPENGNSDRLNSLTVLSVLPSNENDSLALPGKEENVPVSVLPTAGVTLAVSDNTAGSPPALLCQCGASQSTDQTILARVLEELKEIKSQMAKVVKIEANTESLAKQLVEVSSRTSEIEEAVASNAARLREVDDEISTIKTFVGRQDCAIKALTNYKAEVAATTSKSINQMNALVDEQQSQVESFKSCAKAIKKDILCEVDKSCEGLVKGEIDKSCEKIVRRELKHINDRVDSVVNEAYCNRFKNQAYYNRLNLIVVGLNENDQKSTIEVVKEFLSQTLKIGNPKFKTALRLGAKPGEGSQHSRPIMIKFANFEHKNEVWKNRLDITGDNDSHKIRVLTDIPKPLREGVKLMYKVVRAATKAKVYGVARVQNYHLELDDKVYQFSELEKLPFPLRPSTLASPRSEEALAFFTSASVFSNHHPSVFSIGDVTFKSMEQFLAYRKAEISGNEELVERASRAYNPVEAKYILHQLKGDHENVWDEQVENIALEGLRAKFQQNPSMLSCLRNSIGLKLGEASKNPRWGIGLELTDENVLDHAKWSESGNLLGKVLMKVREELCTATPAQNN